MSIVQSLIAGYGVAGSPPGPTPGTPGGTWNPTPGFDAYSAFALSGGDLTATVSSAPAGWIGLRGTGAMTTGTYKFEVVFSGADASYAIVGISDGTADYSTISGATGAVGYTETAGAGWFNSTGTIGRNGVQTGYTGVSGVWVSGDVLGVYLDMTAGTLTFYKNGVSQGLAYNTLLTSGTFYPGISLYSQTGSATANFGATPFAYTYP